MGWTSQTEWLPNLGQVILYQDYIKDFVSGQIQKYNSESRSNFRQNFNLSDEAVFVVFYHRGVFNKLNIQNKKIVIADFKDEIVWLPNALFNKPQYGFVVHFLKCFPSKY